MDSAFDPFQQTDRRVAYYDINGISVERPETYVNRASLVRKLTSNVYAADGLLVLKSPPGTGKTSLLYLLKKFANNENGVHYIRPERSPHEDDFDLFDYVRDNHGVDYSTFMIHERLRGCKQLWLLFDDAQRLYTPKFDSFWEALVKMKGREFNNSKVKILVVVSTTYYLNNRASSPVALKSQFCMGLEDLLSSEEEAAELFSKRSLKPEWVDFNDKLYYLTRGSLGPFAIGINYLNGLLSSVDHRSDSQDGLTQDKAVQELVETTDFINKLDRCFPAKRVSETEHDVIFDALLNAYNLDADDKRLKADEMGDAVVDLCKAGILREDLEFLSPVACQFYYCMVFPRASISQEAPPSLEELVVAATKRLSARRLRTARQRKDQPPKEAVFQQLFHEALYTLLPATYNIIPELGTEAEIDSKTVTGELDFYIKNGKKWALELMRDGKKIGEHLDRIPGKYQNVEADEWLVVDFRYGTPPRMRDENLCSMVFTEDYKQCECSMRKKKVTFHLSLCD